MQAAPAASEGRALSAWRFACILVTRDAQKNRPSLIR